MKEAFDQLSSRLGLAIDGLILNHRMRWGYAAVGGMFSNAASQAVLKTYPDPPKILETLANLGLLGNWSGWGVVVFAPLIFRRGQSSDEIHQAIENAESIFKQMRASPMDKKLFYKSLLEQELKRVVEKHEKPADTGGPALTA